MPRIETVRCPQPRAVHEAGGAVSAGTATRRRALLVLSALVLAAAAAPPPVHAQGIELTSLEVQRGDDGLLLDFSTRFSLPRGVEEALLKGVPLHFVAEASLYRYRWYWRDSRLARATRSWRLSYQPLTQNYRVAFGALAQSYPTLEEALAAVRRSARWRIADPLPRDDDGSYYVEFSYRLDNTQLPRPLQIGVGGQAEWQLSVERSVPVPEPAPAAAAR